MPITITKTNTTTIDYRIYGTDVNYLNYEQIVTKASYYQSAGVLADLNNDGNLEYIFSINRYPFAPVPLIVIGDDSGTLNLTLKYFPNGAPQVGHSAYVYYQDINQDGIKDIVASEAGFDYPPWTGHKIGIAIGNGKYFTDVSNTIPDTTTRSYAVGIADLNGDGKIDILLPAQGSNKLSDSQILTFSGSTPVIAANPIQNYVSNFSNHTAIVTADFNKDGFNDLLFTGSWADQNNRIIYSDKNGINSTVINVLPAGPLGEGMYNYLRLFPGLTPTTPVSGPEVNSIVFDFNNDGFPDVFSVYELTTKYPPGTYKGEGFANYDTSGTMVYGPLAFSSFSNIDGYKFTPKVNAKFDLGYIYYRDLIPFDINLDGFVDVIGHYWALKSEMTFGTTFFINDGYGNFTPIDGLSVLPQLSVQLYPSMANNPQEAGWIVPIKVSSSRFTGLQILSDSSHSGLFNIQEFISSPLLELNLPKAPSIDSIVNDRNKSQFITTYVGNDTISSVNSRYSSAPTQSQLKISLELVSKNIAEKPTFNVLVNGETVLDGVEVNGNSSKFQTISVDLSKFSIINSLELQFNSLKYVDPTQLSYVVIRALQFLDHEVPFSNAIFSNGFAFNSTVAQQNGDGSIKFRQTALQNANDDIVNSMYLNSDVIDSGAGIDTCIYQGAANTYSIVHNASRTWSVFKQGVVNDLLTNVERLKFADTGIALDTSGVGGQAYRVYKAAFNRTPDLGGLGFWISGMDGGISLNAVAQGFVNSAEFKTVYGASPTNAQIVTRFYDNVLGRAAESGGYNYWLGILDSGQASVAGVLASFSESPENQAAVIGVIGNGILYTPFG